MGTLKKENMKNSIKNSWIHGLKISRIRIRNTDKNGRRTEINPIVTTQTISIGMHIYDKYLGVHCLSVVVAEKLVTGAACCTGVAPGVGGHLSVAYTGEKNKSQGINKNITDPDPT